VAVAGPLSAGRGRNLAALAALTVLVRFAVLLCPGPELSEGGRVMAEEMVRGTTALELWRGPLMPLHAYQQPFWGGHLIVSALAAPLVALLGPSLFVLRLVTLPFAVLGALGAFLILERCAGRRAAWIGGLLLALPAPGYLLLSCTVQGTHLEQSGLNLFALALWLAEEERPSARRAFAAGAALGLSFGFGVPALLPIAVVLLADLLRSRRFVLERRFLARLAGFALCAAPFVLTSLAAEQGMFDVYDRPITSWLGPEGALGRAAAKLALLVRADLALSLWLPGSSAAGPGAWAVLAALAGVALWCLAAWRWRAGLLHAARALARPGPLPREALCALVLLLAPAYLLVYLGSHFELGPRDWIQNLRYLMPLWPLLALGAAAELSAWPPRAGAAAGALLLASNALGSALQLDRAAWGRDLRAPAASTRQLARMVAWTEKGDRDGLARVLARLDGWPPGEREVFLHALGGWYRLWSSPRAQLSPRDSARRPQLEAARELLERSVAPAERPFFAAPGPDETVDLSQTLADFWRVRGGRPQAPDAAGAR
jgi:hypothetical protein